MNRVNPSAGVYTSETDLSQRIQSVSTSIGAVVGAAERGPVGQRTLVTSTTEFAALFGKRDANRFGFMGYSANAFLAKSSRLYVTRVVNQALTAGAYVTVDDPAAVSPIVAATVFDDGTNVGRGVVDPMANIDFNVTDPDLLNNLFMVCAENPGQWNNTLAIRIRPSNPIGRPVGADHDTHNFYLDVYENYTGPNNIPLETYYVSKRTDAMFDGQSIYIEEVINKNSSRIRVKDNKHSESAPILHEVFCYFSGGSDGILPTADQVAEAWDIYDDAENIDVNILINAGYAVPHVQRKMDAVAVSRFDAFAILDIPFNSTDVSAAVAYRRNDLNLNSSYSGLYSPWLRIRDTDNDKLIWIPPSGHVAGTFASTDSERAVWFAPAGLRRGTISVLDVSVKYKQGARDSLDQAQINAIRKFNNRGIVVWGASTLQSFASALSDVNVRRLFNYMKKSISTSVVFATFDPNDTFLRRQLVSICEDFLEPIKQGRGLYEYEVVCDERNNPPHIIANNDLVLEVFADPTIMAKRIHLTAHIQPTGAKFSE